MRIVIIALILTLVIISIFFYFYYPFKTESSNETKQKVVIEMIARQWRFEVLNIDNPNLASYEFIPISNTLGNLTITVKLNTLITLKIKSIDVTHGIGINEYRINEILPAGQTTTIEFIANKQGIFVFYCTVFCGTGHPYHIGYLIVKP